MQLFFAFFPRVDFSAHLFYDEKNGKGGHRLDSSASLLFIIAAFALAAMLVMKRDSVPARLRRGMAIAALVLVLFAFFLIVYALWNAGSGTAGAAAWR